MKSIYFIIDTFLILVSILNAGTINIPADYSTIQAGLNAASEGDTVLVQPGTYYENIFWPDKNGIKLISASDRSNTIIDGRESGSVIYMNPVSALIDSNTIIKGFTVMNGSSVSNGGGIFIKNSSPILGRMNIKYNFANDYGGGIYFFYSNPILVDVKIMNNSAAINKVGGGIYCLSSEPKLKEVTISGNSAHNGGGIYCDSSNLRIEDSIISENSALYGGGISCYNSDLTLTNVEIRNNSSTHTSGGGFSCLNSSLTLIEVTISQNSSNNNGGGILCLRSNLILLNVNIINNSAYSDGGGIYCDNSDPTLIDVTISVNSANDEGGGIYFSRSDSKLTRVNLIGNSANKGSGIYLWASSPTLKDVMILKNSGSGIYCSFNSNPKLTDATILENNGGGIDCSQSNPKLTRVTISKIYCNNSSPSLENITISSGIYVKSGNPTINYSNFANIDQAINNADNSNMIDATNNWWGDSTGPYHPVQNPTGQGGSVNAFVNVTPWLTEPDTAAPPIPIQNISVDSTGSDFIDLSWDESPLSDIEGYKIYFDSDESGFPYSDTIDVGNMTSYLLSELSPGNTFYISATCYDNDENESWYSEELVIELISPPVWSNIPDTSFNEDSTLFILKDFFYPFVNDYDDPDSTLLFSFTDNEYVNVSLLNDTLQLNAIKDWNGIDTVSVVVTDGISNDTTSWLVTVNPVNDPPYFTELMPDTINFYSNVKDTLYLEGLAYDIDSPVSILEWFIEKSEIVNCKIDSSLKAIIFWVEDEKISILDTVIFSVSDGQLKSYYSLIVIVNKFTEISNLVNQIPLKYCLKQNYPNPFNPSTKIEFGVPVKSYVEIIVYDITGKVIERLTKKTYYPGFYSVQWDASRVSSGVYLYRIHTDKFSDVKKCIVIK